MPTIISLGSIKIRIFFEDHYPPHFHATEGKETVLIEIESLTIYAGSLSKPSLKTVMKWASQNKELLQSKWDEYN